MDLELFRVLFYHAIVSWKDNDMKHYNKKKPCVPYVCFAFAYFISYIGFLQVVEERAGQRLERTTFYEGIACQPFQSSFHNLLGGSEGSEQIISTRPQL